MTAHKHKISTIVKSVHNADKYIAQSNMSKKSIKKVEHTLNEQIKKIQHPANANQRIEEIGGFLETFFKLYPSASEKDPAIAPRRKRLAMGVCRCCEHCKV